MHPVISYSSMSVIYSLHSSWYLQNLHDCSSIAFNKKSSIDIVCVFLYLLILFIVLYILDNKSGECRLHHLININN